MHNETDEGRRYTCLRLARAHDWGHGVDEAYASLDKSDLLRRHQVDLVEKDAISERNLLRCLVTAPICHAQQMRRDARWSEDVVISEGMAHDYVGCWALIGARGQKRYQGWGRRGAAASASRRQG